jgi:hypothetical protein
MLSGTPGLAKVLGVRCWCSTSHIIREYFVSINGMKYSGKQAGKARRRSKRERKELM